MNKKFCDRCGTEVPPEACRIYIEADGSYLGPGENAGTFCAELLIGADVCDDCECKFIDFMRGCEIAYGNGDTP